MNSKKNQKTVTSRAELAPGWINPEVSDFPIEGFRYTSSNFYEKEWDGMWTKVWLLLGRASEIPSTGDYQVEEIGTESIIMIRQADKSIRAFYNVCQHRGSRLINNTQGQTEVFTCPYHSWEWAFDGSLSSVQDPDDFPQGNPCEELTLEKVACEVFAGFIWINLDPDCKSLKDYLGPLWNEWSAYEIDNWSRVLKISSQVPCNWKVIQDNFCESYHLPTVHPQLADSHEENYVYTQFDMAIEGHNRMIMMGATPSRNLRGEHPILPSSLAERMERWDLNPEDFSDRVYEVRLALQKKMRELGSSRGHSHYENLRDAQLTDSHHYNLFPNCSLTFSADGVLLQRMRPDSIDPQKCFFDHWYYAKNTELADSATNIELTDTSDLQEVIKYGEQSMGLIPDQDIAIAVIQQLGLQSRGYRGGFLSGQESRIRRFHDVIDSYM
jgi:phenylpropionate dioxygenase-like ring-hydroxylating dioxygenase large terminal subunit